MSSFSRLDYQNMLARLEKNPLRDAKPSPGVEREKLLHEQILAFCDGKGWLTLHCRTDRATTVRVGSPDFLVLADGGRIFAVECKRPGLKLRPEQAAWLAQARKLGHRAGVVTSMEQFLELVR
jgi:VRR-NUC domain